MARRIDNKRRISNDRVGRIRRSKSKIIIAVEGNNKTEKLYFNNFDNGKKSYSITIAKGNNTDPVGLVKSLSKEIERIGLDFLEGDRAYCIFDTDTDIIKNKAINDARKYANTKGIIIITSTPSIELWFLLHYEYTTASLSNNEVIKRLRNHYSKYEKNVNIFPYINDKVDKAIENAKRLEKYQFSNNKKIGMVEANPNTEIYKIVEYLNKLD